ncbi:vWA domain-containing protein [Vulcanisaeta souniana]|uniref:VWFA domain-containing protein n=1 Tax=Vulcanisaeta souniana JCM 11219 TaxID=1293586 RepID=A0A830ECN0_9CREN|nr:hypothetical protein [Vulcanisaeta souniana]BDR92244.1 hypothetical protein Vsou_13370 [Vulcanisaeta souniana JCM 11219]GGI86135.1 hypothetical protein GCM10007112_23940 [Vulcanisaeta souniana JCM 11219]
MPPGDSGNNGNEKGTIEKYGYIRWVTPPPFDILEGMIEYFVGKYRDGSNMWPKLFMASDAYGIHDLSIEVLRYRERPELLWHVIMDEYRRSRELRVIRAYTTGSQSLSFYTGVWFLRLVLRNMREFMRDEEWREVAKMGMNNLANTGTRGRQLSVKALLMAPANLNQTQRAAIQLLVRAIAKNVLEAVQARAEFENALSSLRARYPNAQLMPSHSKGLEASDTLLGSPEELRRMARVLNNVVKLIDEFTSRLSEGRITGVGYPSSYTLSNRISEFTVKDLIMPEPVRALRLATIHYGFERVSGRRFNVVIDRSGSMGEPMPGSRIEKVSVATAVAISLVLAYEDVHVYAFDTRIHDLGSGSIVIEPLLRLAPDGGTSIANALTLANSLSEESIIITDAIDPDVDPELARRVMERSRIIILEPAEYFDWVKPYIQGGRAVIAKTPSDVIEFLASPGTAGA